MILLVAARPFLPHPFSGTPMGYIGGEVIINPIGPVSEKCPPVVGIEPSTRTA